MTYKYLSGIALVISIIALIISVIAIVRAPSPERDSRLDIMRPVDETDRILGNQDADITFVEYSDLACPWCKRFHPTISELIKNNTDVQLVYRHLPFQRGGMDAATASECAAEQGGNDVFWNFIEKLFESQGSWNMDKIVADLGLDAEQFTACVDSGKVVPKIMADQDEATKLGITGTPSMMVYNKAGRLVSVEGARSYADLAQIVNALRQ